MLRASHLGLIANDPKADPPDKYKVLENVQEWTVNLNYPGYANAAASEFDKGSNLRLTFSV